GRTGVSLKPGRSLMDWVRLAKSGRDMTGLRGRLLHVTEAELARHNLRDDCWTCIRGLVYNVTAYMEYHPGGEEELMKAAGVDGTELFEQVPLAPHSSTCPLLWATQWHFIYLPHLKGNR
uniref:Cytochrome b5 heme-binding domain-containing protein n=1 Tax=Petromyzon marinus TaxID=7757 RepID=S4RIQ1_PETMA